MTTLSAGHSVFVKRVLPFLAIAGACSWTYWLKVRAGKPPALWMLVAVAAMLTIIMVVVLRRGLWRMADIVESSVDSLEIRRWRTSETVPLTKFKSIHWDPYVVGYIVTLELDKPSAFGAIVQFYAADLRKVPSITNDLESLAQRVKLQRGATT